MGLHRRHEDRSKQERQLRLRPLPKHVPMPSYASSKQNFVYRLPIAILTLMAFLLLTLLTRNCGIQSTHHNLLHRHRHQRQQQQQQHVQQQQHGQLEPEIKEELEPQSGQQEQNQHLPLVCSHQILNPPPFLPSNDSQEHRSPLDGSLNGMTALFQNGVRCFDIDVVTLVDGTFLASHPRRLKQAIEEAITTNEQPNSLPGEPASDPEIVITNYTLESLSQTLGLEQYSNLDAGKHSIRGSNTTNSAFSPFPTFDTQVLPHFAKLVHGIPGAFSNEASSSAAIPWGLKGPVLNIDLKQGPNLTTEKVLELAQQIHDLQLEDYVAVCVMDNDGTQDVDLLKILHDHNTQQDQSKPIPLTLVLRDLVPQDANVDHIRNLVETMYPQSIKALVPSFKFPLEWFQNIRTPKEKSTDGTPSTTNELWKLPMTAWTIDSKADYEFVASLTTTTTSLETIPMASAVVANSPMDLLEPKEVERIESM